MPKALAILAALLASLLVMAIAVTTLAYFRIIPAPGFVLALLTGSRPPEHSARYYPPDTVAYAWVTLAPSGEQLNDMMDLWERFNAFRAFSELVADAKAEFEIETGIDFDRDVTPWIGPDASVGLIDYDRREGVPRVAATIGVRDHDAAADFMRQWLAHLERIEGTDFDRSSRGDFDVWTDDDAHQAYALSPALLVFATSAGALDNVLDLVAGDGDGSLASDADFQAARQALPDDRFTSGYVDVRSALEIAEDVAGDALPGVPFFGIGNLGNQAPDWVAVAGSWVERGIVLETVTPSVPERKLELKAIADPSRLLPADTLTYWAFAFDTDLDRWRDELDEYDLEDVLPYPGLLNEINRGLADTAFSQGISPAPQLPANADLADALDVALDFTYHLSGINFETDFFSYLEGELILAVSEFDLEAIERDPANNAINVVTMLSYDEAGEADLRDTMQDVTALVEARLPFIASDNADVGADRDAVVFPIAATGYQPGFVLHQGYLTLGSTDDAMQAIVARQNGDGETLAAHTEHRRAMGHLPGAKQFAAYVDIQRIINQIEPEYIGLEPGQYRILQEGLGSVAMSSAETDDYARGRLVFTLFPE